MMDLTSTFDDVPSIPRVDEPVIYTFTFRLPYPFRLADGYGHIFWLPQPYLAGQDIPEWLSKPFVRIRLHNLNFGGMGMWTSHSTAALEYFYGFSLPEAESWPKWAEGLAYEQWVSLETPSLYLSDEKRDDEAYAFHRSLTYFSLFTTAHIVAFHDPQVYSFSTYDLAPLVMMGRYREDGTWKFIGPILMHPEALPNFEPLELRATTPDQMIDRALHSIIIGYPYQRYLEWRLRAERAERITGDFVNAIVSFQTSIESRLYDIWRMILVDQGHTLVEVNQTLQQDRPYKSLVTNVLPGFLQGRWDVTLPNTPVGAYWEKVYLTRNQIVHAGHLPNIVEVREARQAADTFNDFVTERLWDRRRQFPRTLLAFLGPDGLARHNWSDPWIDNFMKTVSQEPLPWHWPADIARRSAKSE